ncbi:MAG: hypothetical protein GWO44_06685, partial [Thermoplasmata archaeon]|nr:hypothetical protein [Thermoplasmata archaeon]NIY02966.1 hypothetical protein [Thermoplasmata archaeon]
MNLEWDFGPTLEAGYSLERIDNRGDSGFDQARHGLSAAVKSSLLDDRLGLSLSYEQLSLVDLRWTRRSSQDQRLVGEADLRLLPGLELGWRYVRPVKVTRYGERRRSWGSEELGFSAHWSQHFPLFLVNAQYNRDSQRRIPEEEGEAAQDGQVKVEFESLEMGELTLYPQGTFSFEQQGEAGRGQISLGGEGGLRGELGDFKAQASYKLSSTLDEWSKREEFLHKPSVRLDYGGWKGLSPRLTLQGTVRV